MKHTKGFRRPARRKGGHRRNRVSPEELIAEELKQATQFEKRIVGISNKFDAANRAYRDDPDRGAIDDLELVIAQIDAFVDEVERYKQLLMGRWTVNRDKLTQTQRKDADRVSAFWSTGICALNPLLGRVRQAKADMSTRLCG